MLYKAQKKGTAGCKSRHSTTSQNEMGIKIEKGTGEKLKYKNTKL